MSLFDTIRTTFGAGNSNQPIAHNASTSTGQPPPQQPQPQDKVPQLNPGADPNNLPPNGNAQPDKDPVISQLDGFKNLWDTPATDPKVPDPLTQPLLTFDPAKFATEARKMDFTAGLDPALIQKALSGDAQAFMATINHATQNAFVTASQLSTNLVEGAAKTNNSRLTPLMEKQFKQMMLGQQRTEDAVMQHPAVAPMLDLAKRQILAQNPNLTAAEIHAKAEAYVSDFARVFQEDKSRKVTQESGRNVDPTDFSTWGT